MFRAVLSFLKENIKVWRNVPDMVTDEQDMAKLVAEIDTLDQFLSNNFSGQTNKKEAEKKKLEEMANRLASALAAMADRTGNEVLQAKVDFPSSHIEKLRSPAKVTCAMAIVDLVREYLLELANSNITEADADALKEQATRFKESQPVNRVSVSQRKAGNMKLEGLFRKGSKLLTNRLDKMAVGFEASDPDFYAAYLNARMIIDYGTRYEKKTEEGGETV